MSRDTSQYSTICTNLEFQPRTTNIVRICLFYFTKNITKILWISCYEPNYVFIIFLCRRTQSWMELDLYRELYLVWDNLNVCYLFINEGSIRKGTLFGNFGIGSRWLPPQNDGLGTLFYLYPAISSLYYVFPVIPIMK